MFKGTVSGIMLIMLLIGMFTLALNIQSVKASGTVYIRADGSIDPPTAPIFSADNVTYTFTGNIYESIVVERDNIVLDGAGYTLQGVGSGYGIDFSGRENVTVRNMQIEAFIFGIWLDSNNNSVIGNDITDNGEGIYLGDSSNNKLCHNNFISNGVQVHSEDSANAWDDGYPSGGNYWSDYVGVDVKRGPGQDLPGSDGIGDTPYIIDADNQDNYPLIRPYVALLGDFDKDYDIDEDDVWMFCAYFITYHKYGFTDSMKPFDFNKDGKIDEDDLWTMCTGFINYWKHH